MTDSATENSIAAVQRKQILAKLVGKAPAFLQVVEQLPGLACSNASVLIEGETGTGKELVARAIHYLGPRARYPFIPINCGALADTLLADELFGHERGAFTDARESRSGLIEQAEKGTLFLDEVDSLTPRAQVTLLRVLQDGIFRPLGATSEHQVNVRFVAATNTPPLPLIEAGGFRRDLYYRLGVFPLSLPPLRDRPEDILALASHFLVKHGPVGTEKPRLTPAACSALLNCEWLGNVRELENAVIRGLQRGNLCEIDAADLGLPCASPRISMGFELGVGSFADRKKRVIEIFERQYLTQLISEHQGNVTQAAKAAGRERRDMGKLLKKYQIDAKVFAAAVQRPSARAATAGDFKR